MISTIYKTNALSSQTKQLNHTQCPHLTYNQCPLKKKNTRHVSHFKYQPTNKITRSCNLTTTFQAPQN